MLGYELYLLVGYCNLKVKEGPVNEHYKKGKDTFPSLALFDLMTIAYELKFVGIPCLIYKVSQHNYDIIVPNNL